MPTLDEVIEAIEVCRDSYVSGKIIKSDALHYLKEYQRLQIAFLKALADLEDNPPLDWDELKQMEGKPVWVEADDGKYKGWVIVGKFYSLLEEEDLDAHVDLYYFGRSMEYSKEMYGYYWQAYRKERE